MQQCGLFIARALRTPEESISQASLRLLDLLCQGGSLTEAQGCLSGDIWGSIYRVVGPWPSCLWQIFQGGDLGETE